eukprot:CAMPEP_0178699296 /NCGR_PEP_ID=MMETSP0699-20121125/10994_1 /TAXON_ID=265572 /ORGANISM="Extubocellulus spinifer, Strain CCMP396" /LENGTH=436 /DNA_ID=CAMNT_0020345413 /DNA_START=655 /DNA_END=1962 /DNA_ORIENTATION=-
MPQTVQTPGTANTTPVRRQSRRLQRLPPVDTAPSSSPLAAVSDSPSHPTSTPSSNGSSNHSETVNEFSSLTERVTTPTDENFVNNVSLPASLSQSHHNENSPLLNPSTYINSESTESPRDHQSTYINLDTTKHSRDSDAHSAFAFSKPFSPTASNASTTPTTRTTQSPTISVTNSQPDTTVMNLPPNASVNPQPPDTRSGIMDNLTIELQRTLALLTGTAVPLVQINGPDSLVPLLETATAQLHIIGQNIADPSISHDPLSLQRLSLLQRSVCNDLGNAVGILLHNGIPYDDSELCRAIRIVYPAVAPYIHPRFPSFMPTERNTTTSSQSSTSTPLASDASSGMIAAHGIRSLLTTGTNILRSAVDNDAYPNEPFVGSASASPSQHLHPEVLDPSATDSSAPVPPTGNDTATDTDHHAPSTALTTTTTEGTTTAGH